MTARLRRLALQVPPYAPVSRVAQHDIGFPRDSGEYRLLGGYAVLLTTTVSQDSTELPLARVYFRHDGGAEVQLSRVGVSCGRFGPAEADLAAVFGPFRCDALYLLPVTLRVQPGDLLADFAANRRALRMARFDGSTPEPLAALPRDDPGDPPDRARLAAFLEREFPGLVRQMP